MDATRSNKNFLYQILEAVIEKGAGVINIPDTVGYSTPEEFGCLIGDIMEKVPNIKEAVVSVHCHDDLGMATANSLSAIKCGARQIECSINGIGERAGNTPLEEVVMALKTREDFFHLFTGIHTEEIIELAVWYLVWPEFLSSRIKLLWVKMPSATNQEFTRMASLKKLLPLR